MKETLQIGLAKANKELLDLKTSGRASPAIKMYEKTFQAPSGKATYRITYGQGNQPIITEVIRNNDWGWGNCLSNESSNSQLLFTSGFGTNTVTVVSTRPITSITMV